jgi:hypothetical protein
MELQKERFDKFLSSTKIINALILTGITVANFYFIISISIKLCQLFDIYTPFITFYTIVYLAPILYHWTLYESTDFLIRSSLDLSKRSKKLGWIIFTLVAPSLILR